MEALLSNVLLVFCQIVKLVTAILISLSRQSKPVKAVINAKMGIMPLIILLTIMDCHNVEHL